MIPVKIGSFFQKRINLDGKELINLSDPDCLSLWDRVNVKQTICSLLFQRGFGFNDYFTSENCLSNRIEKIRDDLRGFLGLDVILSSSRLAILNWILLNLPSPDHLILVCDDFDGPILEFCELQRLRYAEIGFHNLNRIHDILRVSKKGAILFIKDGTHLAQAVLDSIKKLGLVNVLVIVDITWTFLDYIFKPSFDRLKLYLFSSTLLSLPHLHGLLLDSKAFQVSKSSFSIPYPSEFIAEAFEFLIQLVRHETPREFTLKSFFLGYENQFSNTWILDLKCPSAKAQTDIFKLLISEGFFAVPLSHRKRGSNVNCLIIFNNSNSLKLTNYTDLISKIKRILSPLSEFGTT